MAAGVNQLETHRLVFLNLLNIASVCQLNKHLLAAAGTTRRTSRRACSPLASFPTSPVRLRERERAREHERQREREREKMCVCVRETACVRVSESESERAREADRERERERERARKSEREREGIFASGILPGIPSTFPHLNFRFPVPSHTSIRHFWFPLTPLFDISGTYPRLTSTFLILSHTSIRQSWFSPTPQSTSTSVRTGS